MPLSRRYQPEWYPGDAANIGMDFSPLIPPGVGIKSGALAILANSNPPVSAQTDFTGPPDPQAPSFFLADVHDRTVYCHIAGGVNGRDYMLVWEIEDTNGNEFSRAALMLCAPTS